MKGGKAGWSCRSDQFLVHLNLEGPELHMLTWQFQRLLSLSFIFSGCRILSQHYSGVVFYFKANILPVWVCCWLSLPATRRMHILNTPGNRLKRLSFTDQAGIRSSITGLDVQLELVQEPSIGSFQLLWRGWAERWLGDVLIRCLIPIRYGLVPPWGFTVCGSLPTHTYTKDTHTHTALSIASFYRADAMLLRKISPICIKGLPSCRVVVMRQ